MKIINQEKKPKLTIYEVQVDQELWTKTQKKIRDQLIKNVEIPGFRKGHVPENKLKEYVTDYDVLPKASNEVIPTTLNEFWTEFDKSPNMDVIQPSLSIAVKTIKNDELIFNFSFDNKPEVKLPDYKNIKIDYVKPTVSEEEINAEINQFIKNDYMLKPKNGVIEIGDMVKFDFKGFVDKKPFTGGEAKDYELEIGSNQFIPGFESAMVGLRKGDEKTITVTFPKDYFEKSLANKPADFEIKINEINTIIKPKLDESYLAKFKLPGVKTEKDLKEYFKENIIRMKNYGAKQEPINIIRKFLIDNSKISFIPENYLAQQVSDTKANIENEAKKANKSLEKYVVEDLHYPSFKEYDKLVADNVLKSINYSLIIAQLINTLNIIVTEKELDKELDNLSKMYHFPVEQLKKDVNTVERIRSFVIEEKLYDKLIELNSNNK